MDQYKKDYEQLKAQIVDSEETSKPNLAAVQKLLEENFQEKYLMLTEERKRAFWRGIIKEVKVYGKTVDSVVFL